jgi:muconate cycloisomerase
MAELARRCQLPLTADESLITPADAETLLEAGSAVWWNIRLSKNGGLARSLALAHRAAESGVPFVIGCMVGETSILSAAQRRLLEMLRDGQPPHCPRFIEGNYGRLVLRGDLTPKTLRFGYGGRLKSLTGPGLGVSIDPRKVARHGQCVRTLRT